MANLPLTMSCSFVLIMIATVKLLEVVSDDKNNVVIPVSSTLAIEYSFERLISNRPLPPKIRKESDDKDSTV